MTIVANRDEARRCVVLKCGCGWMAVITDEDIHAASNRNVVQHYLDNHLLVCQWNPDYVQQRVDGETTTINITKQWKLGAKVRRKHG